MENNIHDVISFKVLTLTIWNRENSDPTQQSYMLMDMLTWFNSNLGIFLIITDKTRDPCIQIILPGQDVFDCETSLLVSLGPELITLKQINK